MKNAEKNWKLSVRYVLLKIFFDGDDEKLKGLNCYVLEFYYLVKAAEYKNFIKSIDDPGCPTEVAEWLPIDKLNEYDVRPKVILNLCKHLPEEFKTFVVNK